MESEPVSVSVKARSVYEYAIQVDKPGSVVTWRWTIDNYDIGFSVVLRGTHMETEKEDTIIHKSPCPISSQHALCRGVYTHTHINTTASTLVFCWDNQHSALRSKQLHYWIRKMEEQRIPLGLTLSSPLGSCTITGYRQADNIYTCVLPYGTAYVSPSLLLPCWPIHLRNQAESSHSVNNRAMVGVGLFFTNQYDESEKFFQSEMDVHAMFSIGYACIGFLRALMTWEKKDMTEAHNRLNNARIQVAKQLPPDSTVHSITKLFSHSSTATPLTPTQLEATLITAESLILQAILNLVEENVMSLINAGLKIRQSHKYYQRCWVDYTNRVKEKDKTTDTQKVNEQKQQQSGSESSEYDLLSGIDPHVCGGIKNGMGAFSVIMSLLPPIMLRLLSFLGYKSNRPQGLMLLQESANLHLTRSPLSALVLLFMHVVIPSFYTIHPHLHLNQSDAVLNVCLSRYPNGSFFLWLRGRQERNRKRLSHAVRAFQHAAEGQRSWTQLQHLCAYELGQTYLFLLQYKEALPYYQLLERENQWSKTFYIYQQAVIAIELNSNTQHIHDLFTLIHNYADRKFAGKTLSLEQFIVQRCEEYQQRHRLILPAYEIIYLYYGFNCMQPQPLHSCLQRVEKEISKSPYSELALINTEVDKEMTIFDYGLLLLLQAAIQRALQQYEAALTTLDTLLSHASTLSVSPDYLIPFAFFERACANLEQLQASTSPTDPLDKPRIEQVKNMFHQSSSYRAHYHFKNRLHLRIHLAVTELKQILADGETEEEQDSALIIAETGGEILVDGVEDNVSSLLDE